MERTVGFLIEADKRGLETTLKSGLENIRSFIKQSEGTPLRWDKIFAAKIPQAVIGVIASSFAAGIANALKAQEEMAKGGANVGKTMEEMNEMFSSAAKSISSTGVSSFEEVAGAISSAYKVLRDESLAEEVGKQAAATADASHGLISLSEATNAYVRLIQMWGITTVPDARKAIEELYDAQAESTLSFGEFTKSIIDSGVAMKDVMDVGELSAQFAALTRAMPGEEALDVFNTIMNAAAGVSTTGIAFATLVEGGVEPLKRVLKDEGLGKITEDFQNVLKSAGPYAAIFARELGLDNENAALLLSSMEGLNSEVDRYYNMIRENITTPTKALEENMTAIDKLKNSWNSLGNVLKTIIERLGIIEVITEAISSFASTLKILSGTTEPEDLTEKEREAVKNINESGLYLPFGMSNWLQNKYGNVESESLNYTPVSESIRDLISELRASNSVKSSSYSITNTFVMSGNEFQNYSPSIGNDLANRMYEKLVAS